MRLDDFLGNDDAKSTVRAMAVSGRFPNAILIEGERGVGKTELAKIIAQAAVCTGEEPPCGACAGCKKAMAAAHPDISITVGGGPRSFHIDRIREIRQDAYVMPNEARRRVFILDNAQDMSEQAQNALLKVLEEPPTHAVFILTAEQGGGLLATVLSRTFRIRLSPCNGEEAAAEVHRRFPECDSELLQDAAGIWRGCVGRMIEAVSDDSAGSVVRSASGIARALCKKNEMALCAALGGVEKNKALQSEVYSALYAMLLAAFRARAAGEQTFGIVGSLAACFGERRLARFAEIVGSACEGTVRSANSTLLLTKLCSDLYRASLQ